MTTKMSVVIPAFNEEKAIAQVIRELDAELRSADIEAEIIVVDDGSPDNTGREAHGAGARVLRHRSNRGYGAALKNGIAAASHDIIAITDADGTYPAKHIPQMLRVLDRADLVVGARVGANVHIPLIRRPAKWALNKLANFVSDSRIVDMNSGLRVFRRDVVMQYFPILPDQFSWTTTLSLSMHCDKYAVEYVPIEYRHRTGSSKIMPWDAGTFAVLILRTAMLFRPLRVFLPMVLVCLAYGIAKMTHDLFIVDDPNISASAILSFLSALFILLIGMLGDSISTRLGRLNANNIASVKPVEYTEWEAEDQSKENEATPVRV